MQLTVNGKLVTSEAKTVAELLVEQNVEMPDMVTVELNGSILRRDKPFEDVFLMEGNVIEFIHYMGGGA
jgi:sulfur carrier protein